MIRTSDISCLILASGASSRFGSSKLLHELDVADGSRTKIAILEKTINIYAQAFDKVNVVVRETDSAIIRLVESQGACCIPTANADKGLSQTIIAGINATSPSKAWLIALGDMPYVSTRTVEAIASQSSADHIVVPRSKLGNGNPVALGKRFEHELLNLRGDVGAKPLVKQHVNRVQFYDCDDHGIHQDIDYPKDIL